MSIIKNITTSVRTHWRLVFSLLFFIASGIAITIFAAPPTNPYTQGETLDPTCTPGSTNCTVGILESRDEGTNLTYQTKAFDFVGSGVSATESSGVVTVTISGISDGDKGDITVSGSGATFSIDSGAVTNTMLAGSIAYSKLSLTGAVLNADLAGSIAASKLIGTDIATVGTITSGTWNGTTVGVGYGGTGTGTTFTQGSLVFAGASGVYTQDNSNLYWDDTNNRMAIGTNTFDGTNPEKLLVAAGTTSSVNVIKGTGSINSYLQLNIQNTSSGTGASSDVVATADNGSETTGYVDMGINGSGYTGGVFGSANDAYLYNIAAGSGGNLLIGTGSSGKSLYFLTGGTSQGSNTRMQISGDGDVTFTPSIRTTGSPTGLTFTGPAHTTLTASTEASDVNFNFARSVQFSAGTIALQRAFKIQAPTYTFDSSATITDAATVGITGAPVKSTNATITNTHALLISAGAVSSANASYGLTVNAQTGATTNYAAQFIGGNVGIGTATPLGPLHVMQSSTGSMPVYFDTYGANSTNSTEMYFRGYGGTFAAPLTIASTARVLRILGQGYDGSAVRQMVEIIGSADGSPASSTIPGKLTFHTTPSGGSSTERMRIDSSGNVGIGNSSPAYVLDAYALASSTKLRTANILLADGSPTTTNYGLVVQNLQTTTQFTSYGVYGAATSGTSSGGVSIGVYGQGTGSNVNYGVRALSTTLSSRTGYGVYASSGLTSGGTAAAVYGGWFDVTHLGTIAKVVVANFSGVTGTVSSYLFDGQNNSSSVWAVRATGQTTIGSSTTPTGWLRVGANLSASAWGTTGISINSVASTYTDTSTSAAATVASAVAHSFGMPTLASTNAITVTDGSNVYIAGGAIKGSNTTLTNSHAILVAAGAVSTATNSYGLTVNAQTGATTNYAAQFIGGNVGVGDASPTALLTVGSGDLFQVNSSGAIAAATGVTSSGTITFSGLTTCAGLQTNGSGVLSCTSDETLKDVHTDFTRGLDAIRGITPKTYSWKTDSYLNDGGLLYSGVIAQNVEQFIPEAVNTGALGYKQVSQMTLLVTAINAIKELDLKIVPLTDISTDTPQSLGSLMKQFLENAGNTLEEVFFGKVHTKELCLDDICITKTQLQQLLQQQNIQPTPNTNGGGSDNSSGSGSTDGGTTTGDVTPPTEGSAGGNDSTPPPTEEPVPPVDSGTLPPADIPVATE